MTHIIIIGCEGPANEPKVTKGLYVFNVNESGKKSEPDITPQLKDEADQVMSLTPRRLYIKENSLYTLTRLAWFDYLITPSNRGLELASRDVFNLKDVSGVLSEESDQENVSKIVKSEQVQGHFLKQKNQRNGETHTDLLASFFLDEKFKEKIYHGFIVRFKDGKLESGSCELAADLPKYKEVTGPMVEYDRSIYVASQASLFGFGSPYCFSRGNVNAAVSLERMLAAVNSYGDFLVSNPNTKINSRSDDPHTLFTNPLALPSEAASLALGSYDSQHYLFFGLNYGLVSVYSLSSEGTMSFQGMLHFLSPEEILGKKTADRYIRTAQDDFVKNLTVTSGEELFFSIRKKAYRVLLYEVFESIKKADDKYSIAGSPEKTFEVPHRITDLQLYNQFSKK